MKEDSYTLVNNIDGNIIKLNDKIDNLGNDNIISHSSLDEAEDLVKTINSDIRKIERDNIMKSCIKGVRVFGTILKHIAPYILVAGLVFGAQTLTFDTPFVRQNQTRIAESTYTTTNLEYTNKDLNYVLPSEKDKKSDATFISKWEKKIDGKYYRTIKEYKFDYNTDSLNLLLNLLDRSKDDKFDNIIQRPKSTKVECKTEDEITNEELEQGDFIQLIDRHYDEEDIIYAIQDVTPNILFTLFFLLITGGISSIIGTYRIKKDNNRQFFYKLQELDAIYKRINIDELKKRFKEGKIRLERVKKGDVILIDPITNKKSVVR